MSERPVIEVPDVKLMLCRVHGEPLRAQWPKGYPSMVMTLMQALVEDEELVELTAADAGRITAILPEFAPLCGRYPKLIRPALEATGLGVHAACWGGCRRPVALGTPYTAIQPSGEEVTRHVCFRCVSRMPCEIG